MLDKIQNLHLIESEKLKSDINHIYDDVVEILCKYDDMSLARNEVDRLLYCYVMSVGKPCAIADSFTDVQHERPGLYETMIVNLVVNYQVTYGYKPYQDLDKSIKLCFMVTKPELIKYRREIKLDQLGI